MAGIEMPYPIYSVTSTGSFDGVNITVNIDEYTESLAPGLTEQLLRAMVDAIAARDEFTGATVTRTVATQTDVTPSPAT